MFPDFSEVTDITAQITHGSIHVLGVNKCVYNCLIGF